LPGVGDFPVFGADEPPDPFAPLPDTDIGTDEPPFVDTPGRELADDAMVDLCAEPDAPESCPEGVGGFILLGIHALPPYQGVFTAFPAPLGGARAIHDPECPVPDPARGQVNLGITANRPSDITVTVRELLDDDSLGESYVGTVATSEAHESAWYDWFADEAAAEDDPRSWLRHCVLFTDLPNGFYVAQADFVDRAEAATLSLPDAGSYVSFLIAEPTPRPDTPPIVRKPTHVMGFFVDLLYVSATREADQRLIVRAVAADASCDVGGDIASLDRAAPGVVQARVTGDVDIPEERLASPDYPYWRHHNRHVGMTLQLEEGTDYLLCLYWTRGGGPAFAPRSIDMTEAIPVSTPSAYRPRLTVQGANDDLDTIEHGTVAEIVVEAPRHFPCRRAFTDFTNWTNNRIGRAYWFDQPLCAPQTGLWDVVARGAMIIRTEAVYDGEHYTRDSYLRMSLLCPTSPCPPRPSESALIPLPEVVTDRRLCGSGFGGGCSGEVPTRRLGVAFVTIDFDITEGNGATAWQIGERSMLGQTAAPLPAEPRLAVTITDRAAPRYVTPHGGELTLDAGLVVTVQADREATWTATVGPAPGADSMCLAGPAPEPVTMTATGTRPAPATFTMSGLCIGSAYSITFTGGDGEGNPVLAMTTPSSTPSPSISVMTAPLYIEVRGRLSVRVPQDGRHYTVMPPTGRIESPDVVGGRIPGEGGMNLSPGLAFSPEDRVILERERWQPPFYGFQTCSDPNPGPWGVPLAGWGAVNSDNLLVSVDVMARRNLPRGGAILTDCVPGDSIGNHVFRASVSFEDLWRGITITSEDGMATLTLQTVNWRFGDR